MFPVIDDRFPVLKLRGTSLEEDDSISLLVRNNDCRRASTKLEKAWPSEADWD